MHGWLLVWKAPVLGCSLLQSRSFMAVTEETWAVLVHFQGSMSSTEMFLRSCHTPGWPHPVPRVHNLLHAA